MVGWYSTGPKIRSSDLEINERFRKYCKNPVLVIIDVQPKEFGIPTEAYMTIDEIKDVRPAFGWASFCNVRRTDPMACMGQDGTPSSRTFSHLPCSIGALEVSGGVNAGMSDSSVGPLRPATAYAQCASRSGHRRRTCSRPRVLFACGTTVATDVLFGLLGGGDRGGALAARRQGHDRLHAVEPGAAKPRRCLRAIH
jgi:hypothetical protein